MRFHADWIIFASEILPESHFFTSEKKDLFAILNFFK